MQKCANAMHVARALLITSRTVYSHALTRISGSRSLFQVCHMTIMLLLQFSCLLINTKRLPADY